MRLPRASLAMLRTLAVAAVLIVCAVGASSAQSRSFSVIRDAEVEAMIKDFAAPFLEAAGLQRQPPVYLVADRRFNAFVVEDGALYINHGTILDSRTPGELKAVIAHEIGHLAGGHLARLRQQAEVTGRMQVLAMALGLGAIVASSGQEGSEVGEMASAFILASQSAGVNSLMAYRRSEENAADATALTLLERTGQSARGLVALLTRLQQNQVTGAAAAPYLSTHPLPQDRLDQVRQRAQSSRYWDAPASAADERKLRLVQAKLVGFLETQDSVLNRFPNSDKSVAARYARIISAYKSGAAVAAIPQMARLAAAEPGNVYFQELLGQMYFETGQADSALPPLQRAIQAAPHETQIRILYGQALIDAGAFGEAVAQLNRSAREEPKSVRAYTLLARAYSGLGRQGEATLAAAEAALARGDEGTALGLARQAQQQLDRSTPGWLRADDIILSLS